MNTQVMEKIKKLLALAGNNPSQEEAQAAMLKAQELMAKHNISMVDIPGEEKKEKEVKAETLAGGQKSAWQKSLARVVANNFRCEFLISQGQGIMFVGIKEDLEICVSVFNYALQVLDTGMRKLRRDYRKQGRSTTGVSDDYAKGFIEGLKKAFEQQISEKGWGLVMVKDEAIAIRVQKMTGGKTVRSKGLSGRGDAEAFNKGYQKGLTSGGYKKQLKGVAQKLLPFKEV